MVENEHASYQITNNQLCRKAFSRGLWWYGARGFVWHRFHFGEGGTAEKRQRLHNCSKGISQVSCAITKV